MEVRGKRSEEATGNFDGAAMYKMQYHIQSLREKAHGITALQKIRISNAINTNVPALF